MEKNNKKENKVEKNIENNDKKIVLTEEQKKQLNKNANNLLKELSELVLKADTKNNKPKIKKILVELETCAKEMESEFLEDVVFIVRNVLNWVIKESKNGPKEN